MRIGIEAQRIFRSKKHGMDIYVLQLIRHLQKVDKDNEYFIFVKAGEDECLKSKHNFRVVKVPGVTYLDWEQIWLPLYASRYRLDVLHCTSNTAPVLSPAPIVLTLHDIIYLNKGFQGGSLYQRLGHYYRKWIVPVVFHKAKKVITVSAFEKKTIEDKFGKDERLMVTYNGVNNLFNHEIPESKLEAVRSKYELPKEYLFFLGNTAPKKNMKRVLEAYASYTKQDVSALPLVVAESSQEVINAMLGELELKHLSNKILLTGYVNHEDLPAIYCMADVFLYPSLRESFGIPIIESMACGTAVITSNNSSMPEVSAGAAHLVDPTDVEDMAGAIYLLTNYSNKRADLVEKGLKRSRSFRWDNTAFQTAALYGKMEEKTVF